MKVQKQGRFPLLCIYKAEIYVKDCFYIGTMLVTKDFAFDFKISLYFKIK